MRVEMTHKNPCRARPGTQILFPPSGSLPAFLSILGFPSIKDSNHDTFTVVVQLLTMHAIYHRTHRLALVCITPARKRQPSLSLDAVVSQRP